MCVCVCVCVRVSVSMCMCACVCVTECVPVDPQTGTRCRSVSVLVPDGEPWLCSLTDSLDGAEGRWARALCRPHSATRQHRGQVPAVTCSKSSGTPADAPQTGGSTAAARDVRASAVKTVVGAGG